MAHLVLLTSCFGLLQMCNICKKMFDKQIKVEKNIFQWNCHDYMSNHCQTNKTWWDGKYKFNEKKGINTNHKMYSVENKYMARLKRDQTAKEHTHFTQIQMHFPLLQSNCPRKAYSLIQSLVPRIYFYHGVTFQAPKFTRAFCWLSETTLSHLPLPSQNENCFSSLNYFHSSLSPLVMQTGWNHRN